MSAAKFPIKVKRGSVEVRVYKTPTRGFDAFTLCYYVDGKRRRRLLANLDEARDEANRVATELTQGDLQAVTLTNAERTSYLRARQHVDALGVPLEVATEQFAHARKQLGGVPLSHAVEFYLRRHPTRIEPKTVAEAIAELLEAKQSEKLSARYLQTLRHYLGKFQEAFHCQISQVTGADVDRWLRGLGLSPRTRNNLRMTVHTLFNFAKARRYLPKDHDEIESVAVVKDRGGEIEVFTPVELQEILDTATEPLIPFLVLGAFAGIRHAEIQRLDWKDVRFEDSIIELHAAKAKTASRRTVPMVENLRAWLLPRRQESGPICVHKNIAFELSQLVRRINAARDDRGANEPFAWKHNALRHSFISYRVAQIQNVAQVALEAGNSPQMIFRHYRELVRPSEARAWFALQPGASILPAAAGGRNNINSTKSPTDTKSI